MSNDEGNGKQNLLQLVPNKDARCVSLVAWFFGLTFTGLKAKFPEMAFTDGYEEEERGYSGNEIRFSVTNPSRGLVEDFVLYHRWGTHDLHVSSACEDNTLIRAVGALLGASSVQCYYSDSKAE